MLILLVPAINMESTGQSPKRPFVHRYIPQPQWLASRGSQSETATLACIHIGLGLQVRLPYTEIILGIQRLASGQWGQTAPNWPQLGWSLWQVNSILMYKQIAFPHLLTCSMAPVTTLYTFWWTTPGDPLVTMVCWQQIKTVYLETQSSDISPCGFTFAPLKTFPH